MSKRETQITVDEIGIETDEAVQVFIGDREVWLPFSQISKIDRTNPPQLTIAIWFAKREGLA
jgi:hypothetical protein